MSDIRTVTLERLKASVFAYLPPELLDHTDIAFSSSADFFTNMIVARLTALIYGEQESAQRTEHKYPADWWQAFKERWFPKLLIKLYPVKYKKIIVDVRCIYPEFSPAIPKLKHKLVIYTDHVIDETEESEEYD